EALISFLDAKGRPSETERVFVVPPGSQLGSITAEQRQALLRDSLVAGVYDQVVDRESAYEIFNARAEADQVPSGAVISNETKTPRIPGAGKTPEAKDPGGIGTM